MINDFAGRDGVALVTGGTGAIGSAVCRLLAERGSDVAFAYRDNSEGALTLVDRLESLGAMVVSAQVDLTDAAAVQSVMPASMTLVAYIRSYTLRVRGSPRRICRGWSPAHSPSTCIPRRGRFSMSSSPR